MTFVVETWGIKKSQERKMDVAEMKVLRRACGHTLFNKIDNSKIGETVKVMEVHRKTQERRLQRYGHVLR